MNDLFEKWQEAINADKEATIELKKFMEENKNNPEVHHQKFGWRGEEYRRLVHKNSETSKNRVTARANYNVKNS